MLDIPTLSSFTSSDLKAWSALPAWPPAPLQLAPRLEMAQTWIPERDPHFRPGHVWLGAAADRFVIAAELEDHDIQTTAVRHNDPLWDLGDVFEVFFKHDECPEYYEFEIAPNGVTLDLRYPRLHAPRTGGVDIYMVEPSLFSAVVTPEPARKRWRVAMEIPLVPLFSPEVLGRPGTWQFSFSRYDCGPDRPPSVSSTSPHRGAGFHRAEEWLHFRTPPFACAAG